MLALIVGYRLYKPADTGVRADVQLSDIEGGAQPRGVRRQSGSTRPTAADDAEWLTVTAWQGDGLW